MVWMHPRIEELLDELEAQREGLRDAVASVPRELRQLEPAPDRWSVAGVLEHLSILETRLTRLFSKKIAEARAAGIGPDPDTTSILATMDRATVRDRTRRIIASEHVQPTAHPDADSAWQAVEAARQRLVTMIHDADGLALGEVRHPHPVLGTLNLYQWIGFVADHEARHADQIREIGASLPGSV